MTLQTARQSSIDAYLAYESDAQDERNEQRRLRDQRLLRFPHAMMLEVAFPELDCVNRWCWTNFGPRDGDCAQKYSEYRVCDIDVPHSHAGVWTDYWFTKTDYNFGFNEWYFADRLHYDQFVKNIPNINWGENYPK